MHSSNYPAPPPPLPQRAEEARVTQQQRVEAKLSAARQDCKSA